MAVQQRYRMQIIIDTYDPREESECLYESVEVGTLKEILTALHATANSIDAGEIITLNA